MPGQPGRSGGDHSKGMDMTTPNGPPAPPKGRSDAFYDAWQSIVQDLPQDALRRVDWLVLSGLCDNMLEEAELTQIIVREPDNLAARRLRLDVRKQIRSIGQAFGLTPADRQRLKIEPQIQEDDPMGELLAKVQ